MKCKEIQQAIIPFNLRKLSCDEEETFVKHIDNCPDCREELEIYYIIEYGLLDEPQVEVDNYAENILIDKFDFKGLVDLRLNESLRRIESMKKHKKIVWAITIFADIMVCAAVVWWTIAKFI